MPACAAAHQLELHLDPLARDPEAFRWRTEAQIDDGRSWLWLEDDVILFKAEASAWTPSAVQIQQVWVDPEVRGRGYGARGMRDLVRLLLETTPTVTLFVRAENAPAIATYEAIGMDRVLDTGASCFEAARSFRCPAVARALGRGGGCRLFGPPSTGAGPVSPGFAPSSGLDARSQTRDPGPLKKHR